MALHVGGVVVVVVVVGGDGGGGVVVGVGVGVGGGGCGGGAGNKSFVHAAHMDYRAHTKALITSNRRLNAQAVYNKSSRAPCNKVSMLG